MGRFLDEPISEPYTPLGTFLDPESSSWRDLFSTARKTLGEVTRPSFGPFISEAISPTPVGQPGLKAMGAPFEYGISRPIATALAGWPTAEKELAQVKEPMDLFGAVGRTLTSKTFSDLYLESGYQPEIAEKLGSLADIVFPLAVMHFTTSPRSVLYRKTLGIGEYAKEFTKEAVDFIAQKRAQHVEIKALKADFINQYAPRVGTREATSLANDILKIIKEQQPTTAIKPEWAMRQQFPGVERPAITIERPEVQPIQKIAAQRIAERPAISPVAPAPIAPAPEVVQPPIVPPMPISAPITGPIPQLPHLQIGSMKEGRFYRGMSLEEYEKGGGGQSKSISPDEAFNFAKRNAQGFYGDKGEKGVLVVYDKGKISEAYSIDADGNPSKLSPTPAKGGEITDKVYYHRTNKEFDIEAIKPSEGGALGKGIYLSKGEQDMPSIGKNVHKVTIKGKLLKIPYSETNDAVANIDKWVAKAKEGGYVGFDTDLSEIVIFDPKNISKLSPTPAKGGEIKWVVPTPKEHVIADPILEMYKAEWRKYLIGERISIPENPKGYSLEVLKKVTDAVYEQLKQPVPSISIQEVAKERIVARPQVGKPYIGLLPGTPEWIDLWKARPDLQEDMIKYQNALKIAPPGVELKKPIPTPVKEEIVPTVPREVAPAPISEPLKEPIKPNITRARAIVERWESGLMAKSANNQKAYEQAKKLLVPIKPVPLEIIKEAGVPKPIPSITLSKEELTDKIFREQRTEDIQRAIDMGAKIETKQGKVTSLRWPKERVVGAPKGIPVFPRKEQLLIQVEEAIVKAPDVKISEKTPQISFEIDGGAKIFNTKQALTEFYNRIKKSPVTIRKEVVSKPSITPTAAKKEIISELVPMVKGYWSDGRVLIKGEAPKAKYKEGTEITQEVINKLLSIKTSPSQLLYYANPDPEAQGVSTQPVPQTDKKKTPLAVFKHEKGYVGYDQFRFNAIRNRFPDAKYGISDNGQLVAYRNEEPVATLMPMEAPTKEAPISELAEEKGFIEKVIPIKKEIEALKVAPIQEVAAKRIAERPQLKKIRPQDMNTEDLEKHIDSQYEANAPQKELDKLENIYAQRVVEDELNMTEEEIAISEEAHQGAGLEEQLVNMYHRYITPSARQGMEEKDILSNMRAAIETYGGKGTDEQILSAAKDIYEHKKALIEKYKKVAAPQTVNDLIGQGKLDAKKLQSQIRAYARSHYATKDWENIAGSAMEKLLTSKYKETGKPIEHWVNTLVPQLVRKSAQEAEEVLTRADQDILKEIHKVQEATPQATNEDIAIKLTVKLKTVISPQRIKNLLAKEQIKVVPAEELKEKGVEVEAPEVAIEAPKEYTEEEITKIGRRVTEIVKTAKTIKDAKAQIFKEFELDISEERLMKLRKATMGGLPAHLNDIFMSNITKQIIARNKELAGTTYGLERLVDDNIEDIKEMLEDQGIDIKERLGEILKSITEFASNLEIPHIYLNSYEDSKPIIAGINDASMGLWSGQEFISRLYREAINKADNKEKLAVILADADTKERADKTYVDVLQKLKSDKSFTDKDIQAFIAFDAVRNYVRDRIIELILNSKLGVKVKSQGQKYVTRWTLKDGTTKQDTLSQAQLAGKIERFGKDKVKVIDQFEKVRLRRVDPNTGKYTDKTLEIKKYDEITKELAKEEQDLINELLPYKNWIPHSRYGTPHDWWIEAFDATPYEEDSVRLAPKQEKKLYSARVPTKAMAERMGEILKTKLGEVNIEINPHSYHHQWNVSFGSLTDLYYYFISLGINPNSKPAQRAINAQRAMSPLFDSMIHATNIPGYKTDWEGITGNLKIKANATARNIFREDIKELFPLIENMPATEKFRRRTADLYLRALIEPINDPLDPTLMILNTLVYFKALANKLTYVIQNLSEPVWGLSTAVTQAKNLFRFMLPLDKEYRALLDLAGKRGLVKTKIYEEENVSPRLAMQKINILGNMSEQWSSKRVFEIGLRLARDKKLEGEEAYRFATHFLLNEGKPFYSTANKPIATLGPGSKTIRRYGFMLLNWPWWWANKLIRHNWKNKIGWVAALIVMIGVGHLPGGRKLLKKLGWDKHPSQWNWFDRFLVGGLPGILGVDPSFLSPYITKGAGSMGSILRSLSYYKDQWTQMVSNIRKYSWAGSLFSLPLAGIENLIAGTVKANQGILRREGENVKVFWRPRTTAQKIITTVGLTPLQLGEKYYKEREQASRKWWQRTRREFFKR